MSKAILVLNEMPDCCTHCKFCNDETGFCTVLSKWVNNVSNTRDYYCPLKPMPEKKDEHIQFDNPDLWGVARIVNVENKGYNNAINDILGEEE